MKSTPCRAMKLPLTRVGLLIALLNFSPITLAQVQKCVDKNGKVSYAHAVCPNNTKKNRTVMPFTPRGVAKKDNKQQQNESGMSDDDLRELAAVRAEQMKAIQANEAVRARVK